MIIFFVRHSFFIIWFLYITNRIICDKSFRISKKKMIILAPVLLFVALLMQYLYPLLTFVSIIICFTIALKIITKIKFKTAFTYSILTLCLNLIIYFISVIIISVIMGVLHSCNIEIPIVIGQLMISIIHGIFVLVALDRKCLTNGLEFLKNKELTGLNIIIAVVLVVMYSFAFVSEYPSKHFTAMMLIVLVLALLMLALWKFGVRKIYADYLKSKDIAYLTKQIEENEVYIRNLEQNNEELASIIHRDNKLLPAMEMAVIDFISSNDSENADWDKGEKLIYELNQQFAERNKSILLYSIDIKPLPKTNIASIDSMLKYLCTQAQNSNISLELYILGDIKNIIRIYTTEDELRTMIADLVENAIIAVEPCENRNIQIKIGLQGECYCISISDSGTPFSSEVYCDLGIRKTTSHTNSGGSGIGMMSTMNIVKKYKASMVITEYIPCDSQYSKNVTILFDDKNAFEIKSYRCNELQCEIARNDIRLYPAT